MNELQVKISQDVINSRPLLLCPNCKNCDTFEIVYKLKSIPRVMTGAPIPLVIELKAYKCLNCGYVVINPQELTINETSTNSSLSAKRKKD